MKYRDVVMVTNEMQVITSLEIMAISVVIVSYFQINVKKIESIDYNCLNYLIS